MNTTGVMGIHGAGAMNFAQGGGGTTVLDTQLYGLGPLYANGALAATGNGSAFPIGVASAPEQNTNLQQARPMIPATVPMRQFRNHYELSLQRQSLFWIRRAGNGQRDASVVCMTLPVTNYFLQAGQITDASFRALYDASDPEFMKRIPDYPSFFLMSMPTQTQKNDPLPAQNWQTFGHLLEEFCTFGGSVFEATGTNGASVAASPPRLSFVAQGFAEVKHIWDCLTIGTALFIATVPIKRLPEYHMHLLPIGRDDVTVPYTDPSNRLASLARAVLHEYPFVKLPCYRNPAWAPEANTDGNGQWSEHTFRVPPVLFHPTHMQWITSALSGKLVNGVPMKLHTFYETMTLEFVGTLTQFPSRRPDSKLLERAPFDQHAMDALPASIVNLAPRPNV